MEIVPVNVGRIKTSPRFPYIPEESRDYLFGKKLLGMDAPRFVVNPDEQDALRAKNLEAQKVHQDAVMAEIRGNTEEILQMSFPHIAPYSSHQKNEDNLHLPNVQHWFQ